jgi:hypothetical protein
MTQEEMREFEIADSAKRKAKKRKAKKDTATRIYTAAIRGWFVDFYGQHKEDVDLWDKHLRLSDKCSGNVYAYLADCGVTETQVNIGSYKQ